MASTALNSASSSSSTNPADGVPISIPARPAHPSICAFPVEIRLDIFTHLLDLAAVPRSYGYTGPIQRSPKRSSNGRLKTLREHAVLLVSKQLSSEYRQCFYERTSFFLRIDATNAFRTVPDLSITAEQAQTKGIGTGTPNFWRAPDALLANLRHCTLFVELGEIACDAKAIHSLSRITRSNLSLTDARAVRGELKTFRSHAEVKAKDAEFDSSIVSAVLALLEHMQQLRSVQLVWDTTVAGTRTSRATSSNTNWTWDFLGAVFLDCLKEKRNMRELRVKVGDRYGDTVYQGKKIDGGEWEGRIVRTEDGRIL